MLLSRVVSMVMLAVFTNIRLSEHPPRDPHGIYNNY